MSCFDSVWEKVASVRAWEEPVADDCDSDWLEVRLF